MMDITNIGLLTAHQLLGQRDKQKHFKVCLGLGLVLLPAVGLLNSIILISLIGLTKEAFDHFYGSGFCWHDLQANMAGLLFAILISTNY
jgi:hypothetical protein